MTLIDQSIKKVFPRANIEMLNKVFQLFNIKTKQQQIAFCSQVGHESGNFTRTTENLNYSASGLANTWPSRFRNPNTKQPNDRAYSIQRNPRLIANAVYNGRLGNEVGTDDGWNYRGRGLIQLTGKSNYQALGQYIFSYNQMIESPDYFIENPDVVANSYWSYITAGAFWYKHNLNNYVNDFTLLTKKINGGTVGLSSRLELKKKLEMYAS